MDNTNINNSKPDKQRKHILIAEELRQSQKHLEAYQMFNQVIQSWRDSPGLSRKLTPRQRWTYAHAGAAAYHAFTHYTETDHLLFKAEELLREALSVGKSDSPGEDPLLKEDTHKFIDYPHPWAWAQLGDVFRSIGNLSAFYFKDDSFEHLMARNGFNAYQRSAFCFKEALRQDPDYGWAKAHYGAMLLNQRRYYSRSEAERLPREALDYLIEASVIQGYNNAWTTDHLGTARFARALQSFVIAEHDNPEKILLDAGPDIFRTLYYTIVSWRAAPGLLDQRVQPGAITTDVIFTILYDLSTLVPDTRAGALRDFLLEIMDVIEREAALLPNHDPYLPYLPSASRIRQHYLRAHVAFLKHATGRNIRKASDSGEDILKLAQMVVDESEQMFKEEPHLQDDGRFSKAKNGILTSIFSVMTVLLKVGIIIKEVGTDATNGDLLRKLYDTLDKYRGRLPVLRHPAKRSVEKMVELYQKSDVTDTGDRQYWLLDLIWSFGGRWGKNEEYLHEILLFQMDKD